MKITIPLLMLAFAISMSSFAQEPELGIVLENQIQEKTNELEQDQYICLGDSWKTTNVFVHSSVRDIKILAPELFKDLGPDKKNCFSPVEVPPNLVRTFDSILLSIEKNTKAEFYVKAPKETENDKNKINPEISLRNEDKGLIRKIARAEFIVGGVEVVGMAALIALPKPVTKWSDNWQYNVVKSFKRAWTSPPVIDQDHWSVNYIGHPYSGGLYYNAMRSQGATIIQSFIFSSVQSTIWEYLVESWIEQPSIQDLIVTPVVGSVVGELSHLATLRMARNGFSFGEKVLVTIINPTYILNNGYKVKFKVR